MGLLCGTTETDKRHLTVDTKDSLKSRMRENCKYGSEEGRRQQCRSSTQQNKEMQTRNTEEMVTISRAEYERLQQKMCRGKQRE